MYKKMVKNRIFINYAAALIAILNYYLTFYIFQLCSNYKFQGRILL